MDCLYLDNVGIRFPTPTSAPDGGKRMARTTRRLALAAGLAIILTPLLAPAGANAVTSTSFSLHATARVTGTPKPYTLMIDAFRFGPDLTQVTVQLQRRATTGNRPFQVHDWGVRDPQFSCTTNLNSCTLDTGTTMGGYGKIHMRFQAAAAPNVDEVTCPRTGAVLTRETTRRGSLTGTFALETSTDYFKKVTNRTTPVRVPSELNATAEKFTTFNRTCPGGGPTPCSNSLVFFGSGLNSSSISADRPLPTGPGRFDYRIPTASGNPDVFTNHTVFARAPGAFLKVTADQPLPLQEAALDLDAFAPFMSGDAVFDATSGLQTIQECGGEQRRGRLTGDFTAHFDGFGDFDWFGSVSDGFTIRRFHA